MLLEMLNILLKITYNCRGLLKMQKKHLKQLIKKQAIKNHAYKQERYFHSPFFPSFISQEAV
jgi:hypothetical protein